MTGLPPAPAEVAAFVADPDPQAYERLIDRLLASPRYGERWARHWLDLARYADTAGFEGDPDLPHAWRYRDYVIDAFNNDKPLAEVIGREWIALADPDHVPAGIYARAALRKLGHWLDLKARIARANNVRAALALVVRREVRAGIVYMSDVLGEPRVRIAATFPKYSHPRIRYFALDLAASKESGLYMDFLISEMVAGILSKHGFSPPNASFEN